MSVRGLAGALVAGALLLAACGGGGGSGDGGGDGGTAPEPIGGAATGTTGAPTGGNGTGGTDLGVIDAERCAQLVGAWAAAIAAAGGSGGEVQDAAAQLQAFAEQAPDEIREDFEVYVEALARYLKVLEEANIEPGQVPTAEQLAALEEASKALQDPKVQAAAERISAWFEEVCGGA